MERYTQWFGAGDDRVAGMAAELEEKYTVDELIDLLLNVVARYEDTGYTPEDLKTIIDKYLCVIAMGHSKLRKLAAVVRIIGDDYDLDHLRGLMTAEREGRLFILQIKPGDSVYWLLEDDGWYISDPEKVADVGAKGFYLSGVRDSDEPGDNPSFVPWDEIGKTVFLSREEAEAALAKMKEG